MSTGIYFPLTQFEEIALADPDILGLFYTGSLGKRTGDRYSDLDIKVWVIDALVQAPAQKRIEILTRLGAVHFFYPSASQPYVTGFVGPDWQRVDIDLLARADLSPRRYAWAHARIVKDTDGVLTRIIAESPKRLDPPPLDQVVPILEESIDSQFFLTLHNARGAVWSAMGEITHRAGMLYTLLARLRGYESFGFRYVEHVLTDVEQALLHDVWPVRPEQHEIRRAARALWTWTAYVWNEAERLFHQPLPIDIDQQELLAAVDRIYTWEHP